MAGVDFLEQHLTEYGITLDRDILVRENMFLRELLRWNQKLNLTAIDDYNLALEKHLLDSLYLLKYLPNRGTLLDLGSGGGLPGIPLALARREIKVISVDSITKKINFQRHVKRKLEIENLTAVAARIEQLEEKIGRTRVEVVTARALSSLSNIVRLAAPWLTTGGALLVMKGPGGEEEVTAAGTEISRNGFAVSRVEKYNLPISLSDRLIIVLMKKTDGIMC